MYYTQWCISTGYEGDTYCQYKAPICFPGSKVPGEIKRSRDMEIKRREVELDLQVSPEETMSKEVELGCESWTSFASSCSSTAVQRTLSL